MTGTVDDLAPWLLRSWQLWAAMALLAGGLAYVWFRRRGDASLATRPWWKKKRWLAALVLWVAVAYPLSAGPAAYCAARGWCPMGLANAAYAPLALAVRPSPGLRRTFEDYGRWWLRLAAEHEYGPMAP